MEMSRLNTHRHTYRHVNIELEFCEVLTEFATSPNTFSLIQEIQEMLNVQMLNVPVLNVPESQGLGLDHCKNEHRHKCTNTWIARMSTRRRVFLVFMALAISCYCQIIPPS